MKLKNQAFADGIVTALRQIGSIPDLPIAVSFKIARIMDTLDPVLETYRDILNKIVEKYKPQSEMVEGQPVMRDPEQNKLYDKELEELHNVEFEVNIKKFTLPEINPVTQKPFSVSATLLYALREVINFPEELTEDVEKKVEEAETEVKDN